MKPGSVELFSTCPPSHGLQGEAYVRRVVETAVWSEECGHTGILVYSDNSLLDAWLVAHLIIQNTKSLSPLVAVQPLYTHPYAVAKMVTTVGCLYGRRMYLNMVAGGFKNDLTALNDTTPHDKRYDRVVEYVSIVARLLAGSVVTYGGEFYQADKLKLTPPLAPDLLPGIFMSGSSEAGLAAARILGATAVKYPKPAGEEEPAPEGVPAGIRVGIIAREEAGEAWAVAHARFPEDRQGQLTHQLAMKVSDSVWHQQLSQMGAAPAASLYWLVPFQNYKTMCPYLVGSYEQVGGELGRYIGLGYRSFILDVPPSADELHHTNVAFERALAWVTRRAPDSSAG
jgi:alkanesulfonate monooxygenase